MKFIYLKTAAVLFCALMSSTPTSRAEEKDTLNAKDTMFVKNEAAAGKAVVVIAQLAVGKAKKPEIKTLAETLVKDHTAVNAELKALATQKGIELSAVMDPEETEVFQKLEKSDGAEFDKKFLSHIISGHKKCVHSFEECIAEGKNVDVKTWAAKKLPALKAHLSTAEALAGN